MFCRTLISLLFLFSLSLTRAAEPRNFLQQTANREKLKKILLPRESWTGYPQYTDRKGWDLITGLKKEQLIKEGESNLSYVWKVVPATSYLEYERSGNRGVMENPYNSNTKALLTLLVAELAEGKGRFLDEIIDGVWSTCDMSSWVLSAHLPVQQTKRNLPEQNEVIIDLVSGDVGSLLSWTWYFLHAEFDKINPIISKKLYSKIEERILDPYLKRSDYWWQALEVKDRVVNNWNPWCNSNVLLCYLLTEQDDAKRAEGVYKTMISTDQFINYIKEDGACEEGPSYWGHAAGKLYDYLQILHKATSGQINLFGNKMIRDMGEYISRSYVGRGWVVNFADASARFSGDEELIYRYGKSVGSEEMCSFAAELVKQNKGKTEVYASRDFFRTIENLQTYPALLSAKPGLPVFSTTWYPKTEFCYMRNADGIFVAAKGGFNNESHNHNDVGTFSLYVNETPIFVDAGVGTYTRQTFGSERYSIWTMQSEYHNLPMINGVPQRFGAEYRASAVECLSDKQQLRMDIAGAYPKEAAVKKWQRTYSLYKNTFHIEDVFELDSLRDYNRVHFLTWAKPVDLKPGLIEFVKEESRATLTYDPRLFTVQTEKVPQPDKRLSGVWGPELYRVVLTAKTKALKGHYRFVITANKKTERPPVDTAFVQENTRIAVAHLKNLLAQLGPKEQGSPRTSLPDGKLIRTDWEDWTSGFFPGSLWYASALSGDTTVRDAAKSWTEFMEPLQHFTGNHDIGFMMFNSFGNGYRFTGNKQYVPVLIESARSLITRFDPVTRSIKSWNSFRTWNGDQVYRFPVIIDNMMNLRLLFFASKISGDSSFRHVALTHAQTAMKNQIREDFSSWHVVAYDSATGKVEAKMTAQGYADNSTWARGQAWGIYGYTETYRETRDARFLKVAQGMADYYLEHFNLPADMVPYWDFNALEPGYTPGIRSNANKVNIKYRDASAAAITASALFELSSFGGPRAFDYYRAAVQILRSLASDTYRAPVGTNGNFILKHSVTSIPHNSQIDVPLVYADYYFLEALYRYSKGF